MSTHARPRLLPAETRGLLSFDALFEHALAYKALKRWDNLYISRDAVRQFFDRWAFLAAPEELLHPRRPEHLAALDHAARTLLERALNAFYCREQRRNGGKRVPL